MTDHTPDYRTVGEHFLDFTITFFNLAKSKYQQQNQIKANSVGFQALILLNQTGRSALPCRNWRHGWKSPSSS